MSRPKTDLHIDRPPKTPVTISYIQKLQDRAKKAASSSKAQVPLTLRIPVKMYEALVELAEEWHAPVAEIARQCLQDGIRKYNDFADIRPTQFAPRTPMQANPGVSAAPGNRSKSALELMYERAKAKEASQTPAPQRQQPDPTEDDLEADQRTSIIESLQNIPPGALFPSTPPSAPTSPDAWQIDKTDALA